MGGTFCRSGGRIPDFEALGIHHAAKPEKRSISEWIKSQKI